MLDTGYWIPCVFVVVFGVPLYTSFFCSRPCRRWRRADRIYVKARNFGANLLLRFAYAVFGPPQVVMTFEPARDMTTNDIYIDTTQVSKPFVSAIIGTCAVVVCMFILVTTWNDFLFKITDGSCTPTNDCFAFIPGSTTKFLYKFPIPVAITNCSEYSDVEIHCFVFTFSFTSALTTFGGLMTATRYISIAVFNVQFWIYRKSNNCIGIVISIFFVILGYFFVFGNLMFLLTPKNFIANSFANVVHRLMFSLCVFIIICSCPMLYYYRLCHSPRFRLNPPQTPASHEANRGTVNDSNDERQPLLSGAANV